MKPESVIAQNFAWCDEYQDNSFLGRLHEEEIWDAEEYLKLERAIIALTNTATTIPRDLAWRIVRIFSYAMQLFIAHSCPTDGFYFRDLEEETVLDHRERFQLIVEGFFRGQMHMD